MTRRRSLSRTGRRLLAVTTGIAIVALPALGAPASGAGSPTTYDELAARLATCAGTSSAPYRVALDRDLDGWDTITVGCVAVLDLRGHRLSNIENGIGVDIPARRRLTVQDTSSGSGELVVVGSLTAGQPGIRVRGTLAVTSGRLQSSGGSSAAGIDNTGGLVHVSGGTLRASSNIYSGGSARGAAIGGGPGQDAGSLVVTGGSVTADGAGAGVGGGEGADGGLVRVRGGLLRARGGYLGSGIGGGSFGGAGGAVQVFGGRVEATGGSYAAGVGGGGRADLDEQDNQVLRPGGPGGSVVVHGGTLVAQGDDFFSEQGNLALGAGYDNTEFGSLEISGPGVVRVPAGNLVVPDSAGAREIRILRGGLLAGSEGPHPTYGQIRGQQAHPANDVPASAGQIRNDGAITMPTKRITGQGVTVAYRHYLLTFDAAGGRPAPGAVNVFADTVRHGARQGAPAFRSPPSKPGRTFVGWRANRPGGGTLMVRADTDLTVLGSAPGTRRTNALRVRLTAVYRAG